MSNTSNALQPNRPALLTAEQLAGELNCHKQMIFRLAWLHDRGKPGGVPSIKIGRLRRFAPEVLEQLRTRGTN